MQNQKQKIKIQKATQKDIDRFWKFFKNSVQKQFSEYPKEAIKFFLEKQYTKRNLRQWIKSKTIILLLARKDSEIVGYLLADAPYGGRICYYLACSKKAVSEKRYWQFTFEKF